MGTKYKGTGQVTAADFKDVKWVGKTKDGKAVTIELKDAINMGNPDWTFAEKNDTVAQVVFTATYDNTDETATETDEPWTVEMNGQTAGASEIILGAGIFYVGGTPIALTRGGGNFKAEREFREINADGDRGPVKGRITMETSRASLTINTLQILTRLSDLYPGIAEVTEETAPTEETTP